MDVVFMQYTPINAGTIYLEVNKTPNKRALASPIKGASNIVSATSLVPIPAKVIGSKPDRIVKEIIKTPEIENKFILNDIAKIESCNKFKSQKTIVFATHSLNALRKVDKSFKIKKK